MNLKELLGDRYQENMSVQEAAELLSDYNPTAGYVSKDVADKYASEAAELKKQLKSKMTADEQAEAERKTALQQMETELATLKKEKSVSEYKAQFLALKFDEKLAAETAAALADGNWEILFQNQKKAIETLEKNIRAEVLKTTPKPETPGTAGASITKEQFDAMNYSQRSALFQENETLYNELNGGNNTGAIK